MIGVQSYAAKAAAAVERNRAAVLRAEKAIAEHDRARPDGDDADALFAWKREARDLVDRLEAANEALAHSQRRAAEAAAEDRRREREALGKRLDREAEAGVKRVRSIFDRISALRSEIDWLAAHRAAVEEFNADRGDLPGITDAERRAREIPGKIIEAEYRDETVWEDGSGNRPSVFRETPEGKLIPREAGFSPKQVRVQTRAERIEPARMPESILSALKLVDITGRQL